MVKSSQIIFMDGKEEALKKLFDGKNDGVFGYLAIGYYDENDNGFESVDDFKELEDTNGYHRIELSLSSDPVQKDESTGKVLVKFTGTLDSENIQQSQAINQLAIVDTKSIGANTNYYSASTFKTFTKTSESSITFVIGFRI